jgi:hypothetical protein
MTNEKRPYDAIWEGDPRRQDAMRERMNNNRYPDYGNAPQRSGPRLALNFLCAVGILLLPLAVWVML